MSQNAIAQAMDGVGDAVASMVINPILKLRKDTYEAILSMLEAHPEIIEKCSSAQEALQAVAALAGVNYATDIEAIVTGSFEQDTSKGGGLSFSLGTSALALALQAEYQDRVVSGANATVKMKVSIDNGGTLGATFLASIPATSLNALITSQKDYVNGKLGENQTESAQGED